VRVVSLPAHARVASVTQWYSERRSCEARDGWDLHSKLLQLLQPSCNAATFSYTHSHTLTGTREAWHRSSLAHAPHCASCERAWPKLTTIDHAARNAYLLQLLQPACEAATFSYTHSHTLTSTREVWRRSSLAHAPHCASCERVWPKLNTIDLMPHVMLTCSSCSKPLVRQLLLATHTHTHSQALGKCGAAPRLLTHRTAPAVNVHDRSWIQYRPCHT